MFLPYYCVFKNGQSSPLDHRAFKLHDSLREFHKNPRVFTSICASRDKAEQPYGVMALDLHLKRLLSNAKTLEIEFEDSFFNQAISAVNEAIKKIITEDNEILLRLLIDKSGFYLFADKIKLRWNRGQPIRIVSYHAQRPYPQLKTTATSVSLEALSFANSQGAEEALLIAPNQNVSECAWANFFWVTKGDKILTSPGPVLPGISREIILNKLEVELRETSLQMLLEHAKEAFITSSIHGITPVSSIDSRPLESTDPNSMTNKVINNWSTISKHFWQTLR